MVKLAVIAERQFISGGIKLITLIYFILIIFFIASESRKMNYLKRAADVKEESRISIIIPAKDEEENIDAIILSSVEQNYPKDKFEVIIVNDRSNDKTKEIAESYLEKYDNLKVINITEPGKILTGKQNALDIGIKSATGEIIVLTDADCIVNKNWIKSMNKFFINKDVGLVVGKTEIMEENKKSFLYKVQAMSHRLLMEVAQVPIMYGLYTSGMGNNIALRKKGYDELGGYEGLGNSILDDEILVRGFARKGYKIAAAFNQNAVVETKYMDSYRKMFKQHKRWIVGSLNIFTPSGILAFILYALNIYTIYLLCRGSWFVVFKFLADYMLFIKLNRTDKKVLNIFDEVLITVYNTFYVTIVATAAIVKPNTNWKQQKYSAPKQKQLKL